MSHASQRLLHCNVCVCVCACVCVCGDVNIEFNAHTDCVYMYYVLHPAKKLFQKSTDVRADVDRSNMTIEVDSDTFNEGLLQTLVIKTQTIDNEFSSSNTGYQCKKNSKV